MMEEYYLIARSKETNKVSVISIKETWYLKEGMPTFKRRNSLEAIDLVTTRFKSSSEMIQRMYENGYLDTVDVDLFAAKKIKKGEKEYIKFHELIYNPLNKGRIDDLRKIAYSFLDGAKEEQRDLIDKVFNKLISKANSNEDFRGILTCEMSNVPKRITDNFWKGKQNYSLKYQNLDSLKNYTTIRSIIEILNRYDFLETLSGNAFNNNVHWLNENGSKRKEIEKELLEILDKDYMEGQYNLFDYLKEESGEVTKDVKSNTIEIPDISKEEKEREILSTFKKIPFGFLNYNGNRQSVNTNDLFYKEQLENMLPDKLFLALSTYTVHKNEYDKNLSYGGNTYLLEQEIRQDEDGFRKFLKKCKNIDRIFLWTLIYKEYRSSLENISEEEGDYHWKK